jgi:energy-coupling factor transporter ATP-binding protein EcfA2
MLVQLAIRDIVLIDRLDLQLSGGLTVLTGETGAGKSILLDAFALALGGARRWRAGARGPAAGAGDGGVRSGRRPSGASRRRGRMTSTSRAISSCAACKWRTGARAPSPTIRRSARRRCAASPASSSKSTGSTTIGR